MHKYLAKQHTNDLSNDDGDILQRWRRNRMANSKKIEKEETEEDFLEKYLKKKDQGKVSSIAGNSTNNLSLFNFAQNSEAKRSQKR